MVRINYRISVYRSPADTEPIQRTSHPLFGTHISPGMILDQFKQLLPEVYKAGGNDVYVSRYPLDITEVQRTVESRFGIFLHVNTFSINDKVQPHSAKRRN